MPGRKLSRLASMRARRAPCSLANVRRLVRCTAAARCSKVGPAASRHAISADCRILWAMITAKRISRDRHQLMPPIYNRTNCATRIFHSTQKKSQKNRWPALRHTGMARPAAGPTGSVVLPERPRLSTDLQGVSRSPTRVNYQKADWRVRVRCSWTPERLLLGRGLSWLTCRQPPRALHRCAARARDARPTPRFLRVAVFARPFPTQGITLLGDGLCCPASSLEHGQVRRSKRHIVSSSSLGPPRSCAAAAGPRASRCASVGPRYARTERV